VADTYNLVAEVVVDVPSDEAEYREWVRSWLRATLVVFDSMHVVDGHASGESPGKTMSGVRALVKCASERLGGRTVSRRFTAANLEWAIGKSVEGRTVACVVSAIDEQGWDRGRDFVYAQVWRDDDDKSWAQFTLHVPEEGFRGAHGREVQAAVLDAVRALADVSDPVYGEAGFPGSGQCTRLEEAMRSWGLFDTFARARHHLRGYNWVTVVPRELVERLGGAGALRAAGVFCEVLPLAHGGAWLRATGDFLDYGEGDDVQRVFQAVAKVLPPGLPRLPAELGVPAKHSPIVLEDAADYGARP
jgi:hypothetical protein